MPEGTVVVAYFYRPSAVKKYLWGLLMPCIIRLVRHMRNCQSFASSMSPMISGNDWVERQLQGTQSAPAAEVALLALQVC